MVRVAALVWVAASVLTAACWTLTTDTELTPAGVATPPGSDAGVPEASAVESGAQLDGADAARRRALCDEAGSARFKVCFDYDAPADEEAVKREMDAFGPIDPPRIVTDDARSAPGALVISFPPLTGQPAGGRHSFAVDFTPKRVRLAYDVRLSFGAGVRPRYLNIGGFLRAKVLAFFVWEIAPKQLFLFEQDQRDGTKNGTEQGRTDVDLEAWHRLELAVDLENEKISSRVDGVSTSGELPLQFTDAAAAGEVFVGTPYLADTSVSIAMHFDNVVILVD